MTSLLEVRVGAFPHPTPGDGSNLTMVTNSPSEGLQLFAELITGVVNEGSLEVRADRRGEMGKVKIKFLSLVDCQTEGAF